MPLGHSLSFSSTRAKATGLRHRSTFVQRFDATAGKDEIDANEDDIGNWEPRE
ncbi:MAG TPA: hypothetical protein VG796_04105 [Verrucomicrobiales bacterium]|nr:hypothetical protein [Verrucomicrobiales bacterium]